MVSQSALPFPRVSVPFPSGPPKRQVLEKAIAFLRGWPVELACPLLEDRARWKEEAPALPSFPSYLCGTDEQRGEEIVAALTDASLDSVWCGRGGYGATRLLRRLDSTLDVATLGDARLLGYSDITALFAWLRSRGAAVECVHSPVVTEISDHPRPEVILEALRGTPCSLPVEQPGRDLAGFHGPLWGGNLAVLASLCGTPWLPNIEGCAAFLEDVDEAPYRLDRFVTQLHDSGFFANTRGVFLGRFTRCGADDAGFQVVKERCSDLGLEVLGVLPIGHEPLHLPLFLDRPYRYDETQFILRPQT